MVGEEGVEYLETLKREQRRLLVEMTALDEDYKAGTIDQKTHGRLSTSTWEALTNIQRRINAIEPSGTRTERVEEYREKVRTGYLVGGGLTAAIFFGLFYWADNYTYTERVWHELPYVGGYWTTVTRTIDPAIQALFLAAAIIGLVAMVYGAVSRK